MSLCEHGYTANLDCPECECPCGSGASCAECRCVEEQAEDHRLDDPRHGQADSINRGRQ
jgi:hypothetical protein